MTRNDVKKSELMLDIEKKFNKDVFSIIKDFKFDGLTNKQISFRIGVHKNTISNWMRDYSIPKRPIRRVWENEIVCLL